MSNFKTFFLIFIFLGVVFTFSVAFTGFYEMQKLANNSSPSENAQSISDDLLQPEIKSTTHTESLDNAKLIIPKIAASYKIQTDTVNHYHSVYHYSDSVMPGENGVCGLLGHRTTYSAPFRKLHTLKVGDNVIIRDYNISKEYTYQVTSNGKDIRWDYKSNPVQFEQDGEPRLMLITCYRPAKKTAAWITHCKLVSVSDIK